MLLAERGGDGSLEEAIDLATEATATGRALQLHGIEGAASRVFATLRVRVPEPLLAGDAQPDPVEPARPHIRVIDGFSVRAADGTEPHWRSRKARQLLKILVARRGAAVSRESLMDTLWPGLSPAQLANRFSVAATAVRRALDPKAAYPRDAFLVVRDGLVRLRVEALDIDVEHFLSRADAALRSSAGVEQRIPELASVLALYAGEPLHEEQEELWAADFRREAHLAFFSLAHALAELYAQAGDHLSRLETYRRVLAFDEYDQRAHEGVIDALMKLGSHGQADAARSEYAQRMDALGVPFDQHVA